MPLSISYSQGLTSAWSNVATFVPKLVAFLIIVIIGYVCYRVFTRGERGGGLAALTAISGES